MITEILDDVANSVIESVTQDLSNPETIAMLRESLDEAVIRITGINIRNPFIYPHYTKMIEQYQEQLLELVGIAVSNPPESIDTTAEVIKEEVGNKVDSLADKLKKRLTAKESNHDQ